MTSMRTRSVAWWLPGLALSLAAAAQDDREPRPAAAAASAPARAASAPARTASAPRAAAAAPGGPDGQKVDITGARESDVDQRRQSTAARIVIGREEIQKFGDSTVGEVLRRLPGVTAPGAPGRGGPPRMRGLGSGYTQLLIDGQRMPPGFSLDSLAPEQLERIEILRAPTAETGARAIAGTINIVTREGYRRRLNEINAGAGHENGRTGPGLRVTRNDAIENFVYNVSLATFRPRRASDSETDTLLVRADDGSVLGEQHATQHNEERRIGVALTTRLQWRLGEAGEMLLLTPHAFYNEGRTDRRFALQQSVPPPPALPLYEAGEGFTTSRFSNLRLNGQWRQRVFGLARLELHGGAGMQRAASDTQRSETGGLAVVPRTRDDLARSRERSGNLTLKLSGLAGGRDERPGSEHSLVGGVELEGVKREETRILTQDGSVALTDFGDEFSASTLRSAAYLQDEWSLDAHWALHAGLRWEGIRTRGDPGDGSHPTHRTSVTTPLVHVLWKPDPRRRDQVRLSLTRSYRAPSTQSLIARPVLNSRHPAGTANQPTAPDSAGNPDLKPELANGIDLAFERYLEGGGLLSANLFHRRIRDLMRSVTTLETVSWGPPPDFERWVARQQNVGKATTQGVELEAKYRLNQLVAGTPPVELRHNLALYRSRVDGVPGPDNRLDQQARATANLGADYRLRGAPLTLGGNLNWVPGYHTQLAADRAVTVASKRVLDVFALWTVGPELGVRLLGSNVLARNYASRTDFSFADPATGTPLIESVTSGGASYANWQLRLELKL